MNKTLLGDLQPREVNSSKGLRALALSRIFFQQGPTGDVAAYCDGMFLGLLLKLS